MHTINYEREPHYEPRTVPVRQYPGAQRLVDQSIRDALARPCRYCGGQASDHVPGCRLAWPEPAPTRRWDYAPDWTPPKPCRSCKWVYNADRVEQHAADCKIAHPRPKGATVDRVNGASSSTMWRR